jgi:PBP1b-binding outer membrane lipoprotein LpoB
MKKICTLVCLLILFLVGCNQEQHYEDDDYNNKGGVNEMEERVYDWENSVRIAREAFPDVNPEFVEGHIVRTIIMDGRVNGIIRMEEIKSDPFGARDFEIESEDGLIFHVHFLGNHIDAIVDPETGMPVHEIIE